MCDILSMQCVQCACPRFGRFAWRTLLAPMKNLCTYYYYNQINVVRTVLAHSKKKHLKFEFTLISIALLFMALFEGTEYTSIEENQM